nr:hypothetical protein [Tanacetum cinerariifolium]
MSPGIIDYTSPPKFSLTRHFALNDKLAVIIDIIFAIVKILSTKRQTGSFSGDMSPGIVAWDSRRSTRSSRDTAEVMVIDDNCWTLLERHERAFYIDLEKFVDHCKPLVNSAGKIRCPCKSCRTILWVSIKHLSDHIMRHEFDLGYKTWVHHGEPDLPPPPLLIDNTRQPQMSDMTALLNDLSYIPPNNEHNETSNKLTQATGNEFEELYASANEELYLGCDYVTRLDFMAKFTY